MTKFGVSTGDSLTAFAADEKRFGKLALRDLFQQWPGTLTAAAAWLRNEQADKLASRIALLNVRFGDHEAKIASGVENPTIVKMAAVAAAYAAPLWVRWDGEFDRHTASAAEFKQAWTKVVTSFRQAGATNVKHLWCPTMYGLKTGNALPFYPGDNLVDMIAPDGYNWPGGKGRSFETICIPLVAFSLAHGGKPMCVPETATRSQDTDGARAMWISEAGAYAKHVNLQGFCYFDSYDPRAGTDWRIPAGSRAEAAYRTVVATA